MKKAFTTAPVLARWSPGDPLIVETDASDYALGAILSTIDPSDNQVYPIAFHSRTFTSPELNYDIVTVVTPSQLRYSCYSSNVPRLHIILQVELLTPFTSGLPFLLCSSFVLFFSCSDLLFSILRLISDLKLRTPCYVPFLVIVLVVPHNRLIIFPFRRYIHSHGYIYE